MNVFEIFRGSEGLALLRGKRIATAMLGVAASLVVGCGRPDSAAGSAPSGAKHDDDKVLNFYNWSDYIAPDTIASFEKLSGIKVHISYFDTNETLEGRVLTGNSGFDVVVPTAPFMQRQIRSGAYLPLDEKQLPNLVNLDPAIMARVALNDPGNAHGVVYMWGTYGGRIQCKNGGGGAVQRSSQQLAPDFRSRVCLQIGRMRDQSPRRACRR